MRSAGVDPQAEQWGTLALCTTAATGITYRTAWADLSWGDSLLDFWDDFSEDDCLEERVPAEGNSGGHTDGFFGSWYDPAAAR